jgi:uncharacterized membrane protein YraQ (UPF0718 family)
MNYIKRFWLFSLIVVIDVALLITLPSVGRDVVRFTGRDFREMLLILPPVFVLLGLMDVWVPRETMTRLMGDDSGLRGMALGVFLGAAAAGPLYGAFPIALALTRKGASLRNVMIFVGSWSTLKIPMFLFETAALGPAWSVTRWLTSLMGVVVITLIIERLLRDSDRQLVFELAKE